MSQDEHISQRLPVSQLFSLGAEDFVAQLGDLYEKSPWVAERFFKCKKQADFDSASNLAAAMKAIVDGATQEEKLKIVNSHPDLAGKAAMAKDVTESSLHEQKSAGLTSMTSEEYALFNQLNSEYKAKFGIVFILAVRNASKHTILKAFEYRLKNNAAVELATCLAQVHKIAWMRILEKFQWNMTTGFLTCHILDTARGTPAAGMQVDLYRIDQTSGEHKLIKTYTTNSDGRTGKALDGQEFTAGIYEWIFHAGPYFASVGLPTSGMPFLDQVPIRFGIDNPEDHYHVPLLVSPWSFSTYRGS